MNNDNGVGEKWYDGVMHKGLQVCSGRIQTESRSMFER